MNWYARHVFLLQKTYLLNISCLRNIAESINVLECGARFVYHSVAPEITPGFLGDSCFLIFSFLCCDLYIAVCLVFFKTFFLPKMSDGRRGQSPWYPRYEKYKCREKY